MERYLNRVVHGDALQLLRVLPTASIDAVITDAMYGTSRDCRYDWGVDPAQGDPVKHWLYHQPIYEECLRVLKPGSALAWGQSAEFARYYDRWFKGHRQWTLLRHVGRRGSGHLWVVQTREQRPIELNRSGVIECAPMGWLKKLHPCIKPPEELAFMVEALTRPGDVVLDIFAGLGSTLLAAQALDRHWIGCEISRRYCQVSMARLQGRMPSDTTPPCQRGLAHGARQPKETSVETAPHVRPGSNGAPTHKPQLAATGPKSNGRDSSAGGWPNDHRAHDTSDDLNFYPTPPWATEELLRREAFGSVVWEPACGDGAISKVLEAAGYAVLSSDIRDRGYGEVLDFFETQRTVESIVTNPDYGRAEEFVRRALASTTYKVAMLLRASFYESQRRAPLFAEHPPKRIYVFARRLTLYPAGERGDRSGGHVMYAWFVWEHGFKGETTIQRIE
jgi:hypothetical protein